PGAAHGGDAAAPEATTWQGALAPGSWPWPAVSPPAILAWMMAPGSTPRTRHAMRPYGRSATHLSPPVRGICPRSSTSMPIRAREMKRSGRPGRLGQAVLVAGGQGFEPRLADPESAVLPLDDPPPSSSMLPDGGPRCNPLTACSGDQCLHVRCE